MHKGDFAFSSQQPQNRALKSKERFTEWGESLDVKAAALATLMESWDRKDMGAGWEGLEQEGKKTVAEQERTRQWKAELCGNPQTRAQAQTIKFKNLWQPCC